MPRPTHERWRLVKPWILRNSVRLAVALALPWIIVDLVCEDNVLASIATGGEWLRLNASGSISTPMCFGRLLQDDRYCRLSDESKCTSVSGSLCIWAPPREMRCSGVDVACAQFGQSRWRCLQQEGCNFTRPLDDRLACRGHEPHSPFGGARCNAFYLNADDAMPLLRSELRWILLLLFGFLLCNCVLLEFYGSIDALVKDGKPMVLGVFLLVAALGNVRRSLVEHGELRLAL
jgi:hypothetical protein